MNVAPCSRVAARVLLCIFRDGLERETELLGLEAVRLEVVKVLRLEVRAGLLEPRAFVRRELQFVELWVPE